MCGEKANCGRRKSGGVGSPPRVRGKVVPRLVLPAAGGITPACAGKSFYANKKAKTRRDHPRVCGEKQPNRDLWDVMTGSPPRVRGKELLGLRTGELNGITPACAGKRNQMSCFPACSRDHPLVCGEKAYADLFEVMFKGSPPRVRGKVRRLPHSCGREGITPACAGKRCPVRR